jgi:hypothetical protein
MEDPERKETDAAEDSEDLDLEPDETENVKGGITTGSSPTLPPPPHPAP